jgi:hypothetical protein
MKVILRSVTKEEHSLDVDDGCTVGQLRAKADSDIGAGAGIGSTLIFKGTVLKDDGQALSAAGVADGDFIIMLAKKVGLQISPPPHMHPSGKHTHTHKLSFSLFLSLSIPAHAAAVPQSLFASDIE